jgi:hypothetical protein
MGRDHLAHVQKITAGKGKASYPTCHQGGLPGCVELLCALIEKINSNNSMGVESQH